MIETRKSLRPGSAVFRVFALLLSAALLLPLSRAFAGTQVSSARIWPAEEYTRLTLESDAEIVHNVFTIANPRRLVIDLDNVDIGPPLEQLAAKISADDPYVSGLRIGRFKPGVIRLVLELKTDVKPQIFSLQPIGTYGHRLVIDVYPMVPLDPILTLLQEKKNPPGTPSPKPDAAGLPAITSTPKTAPAEVVRLITIAVDAGHGGEDPGARGRGGTYEKHVTLAIARRLKDLIDSEPSMRAVMIRSGDYFVPLGDRVKKAQKTQADLFVSIHADAYIKPHARGSSVFALSERGATSAAAEILAEKENQSDLIGGVNRANDPIVNQVIVDLSQTATIHDSLKLAKAVLGELGEVNDLHKAKVEQAGFAVLKAPEIPSILVETAFLTNPEEEKKLKDEKYQEKMAQAILVGIRKYFATNPPLARKMREL
ncbi:MAG: N-acetylmuramoyl-L-alanine amidase [Burkholderiales bacterium]